MSPTYPVQRAGTAVTVTFAPNSSYAPGAPLFRGVYTAGLWAVVLEGTPSQPPAQYTNYAAGGGTAGGWGVAGYGPSATITIPGGAAPGFYSVNVQGPNPDGGTATLADPGGGLGPVYIYQFTLTAGDGGGTGPSSPPPGTTYVTTRSRTLAAAMTMAQGGGSPHLHLAVLRTTVVTPFLSGSPQSGSTLGTSPLRACSCLSAAAPGGPVFGPGVDVGVLRHDGASLAESPPSAANADYGTPLLTSFVATPGGGLFAFGQDIHDLYGESQAPQVWQSPRVCRLLTDAAAAGGGGNAGASWRAAATSAASMPAPPSGGSAAFLTSGAAEAAHGGGGKSGGGWLLLLASTSEGGLQKVVSLDGGDTWALGPAPFQPPGALHSVARPAVLTPLSFTGWTCGNQVTVGGVDWSLPGLAVGGDGEAVVAVMDVAGVASQYVPAALLGGYAPSATPDYRTLVYSLTADEGGPYLGLSASSPLVVSGDGRGGALSPILPVQPLNQTVQATQALAGTAAWAWPGGIALACYTAASPDRLSVFVSRNRGGWYTPVCHSDDDGQTWVQPKPGQ